MFSSVYSRYESVPEVVIQSEYFLSLGIDKDKSYNNVHGAYKVCSRPEKVCLYIIEEQAGKHIVNHIHRCGNLICLSVAKGIVYGLCA